MDTALGSVVGTVDTASSQMMKGIHSLNNGHGGDHGRVHQFTGGPGECSHQINTGRGRRAASSEADTAIS